MTRAIAPVAAPVRPQFPPIDTVFLTELALRFPNKGARLGQSIDTIMHEAGQQSVIRFLQEEHERQSSRA